MRPLVIAHRGASWDLPENTLPAFERAVEVGADYVELDVHADGAGRLVVCHDAPGRGETPPTLAEAMDVMRGRVGVLAELKMPYRYRRHDVVSRTLALLDDDADGLVCFEPGAIAAARALRPRLRTVQHVGLVPLRLAAARGCWAAGFRDRRASARSLAAARRLGLEPLVYTVNEPARMLELAALGAGGIFTDRPALALQVLAPPRRG